MYNNVASYTAWKETNMLVHSILEPVRYWRLKSDNHIEVFLTWNTKHWIKFGYLSCFLSLFGRHIYTDNVKSVIISAMYISNAHCAVEGNRKPGTDNTDFTLSTLFMKVKKWFVMNSCIDVCCISRHILLQFTLILICCLYYLNLWVC